MTSRYFIARFIENLARKEAKNIGVFYLDDNVISARFLGERPNATVDLRSVRSLVPHTPTYKQWIEYWRNTIVHSQSPGNALRDILSSAKGNFVIDEGDRLFIPKEAAQDSAHRLDYLFHLLVDEFPPLNENEVQRSLSQKCNEIIRKYRLRRDSHLQETPSVPLTTSEGTTLHLRPSYHWLNERSIYFQKVSIDRERLDTTQRDVYSTTWMFEKLRDFSESAERKALVRFSDSEGQYGEAWRSDEYLKLLESVSDSVINVDDEEQVDREFRPLVTA